MHARPRQLAPMGLVATAALVLSMSAAAGPAPAKAPRPAQDAGAPALGPDTQAIVTLVDDAAAMIARDGAEALEALRAPGGRFRHDETYVFVLDTEGTMLLHPDPSLEGTDQRDLKDIRGRPIIRDMLEVATAVPARAAGFTHYEWPVPGGLLPRWKTSYVRRVAAPDGRTLVVGCGRYTDAMERAFVVDIVNAAAARVEREGAAAFVALRDPTGPFRVKDTYVFVLDRRGKDLVNPGFPNLEGRDILDVRDARGARPVRAMIDMANRRGAGWVDYLWPRPGESVSTQKSTYVRRVKLGTSWVVVGAGVYVAEAPRPAPAPNKLTAGELVELVDDAAALLESKGAAAYPELRRAGSPWRRDDTYVFVWGLDGTRVVHGADPTLEGTNGRDVTDVLGRPYGRMFLDVARGPTGEGWVHYMYPEPGDIFPTWKSAYLRRVTLPDGEERLVGSAVYNMDMDSAFIEDVVERAAELVARRGRDAFPLLRDPTGPFRFMDTYVFVGSPDGVELVNPAQPSLEGSDLSELRDVNGVQVAREYIDVALRDGGGWTEYVWFRPGTTRETLARKQTYVRRVLAGPDTFIVGAGLYAEDPLPDSLP